MPAPIRIGQARSCRSYWVPAPRRSDWCRDRNRMRSCAQACLRGEIAPMSGACRSATACESADPPQRLPSTGRPTPHSPRQASSVEVWPAPAEQRPRAEVWPAAAVRPASSAARAASHWSRPSVVFRTNGRRTRSSGTANQSGSTPGARSWSTGSSPDGQPPSGRGADRRSEQADCRAVRARRRGL